MNLKTVVTKYHGFFTEFSGFVSTSLIFLCGIGRYRLVVVYAVYCLLKALPIFKNIEKVLFLPATVVAVFFDITKGPIYPVFSNNNLLITLPVLIIADAAARSLINKLISNISEKDLFVACPSCNYDNKELVRKCIKCSYDINKILDKNIPKISTDCKGDKIPPELLHLINLEESEEILFHKKLSSNLVCYKNDNRELRKHFIIATSHIILIDYSSFGFHIPKSYREIDIVPMNNIEIIKCEMRTIFTAKSPFLEIKTLDEDVFGISFSSLSNYKNEMYEITNQIRKANTQVKTIINIPGMPS